MVPYGGGDSMDEKHLPLNNIISAHGDPRTINLKEGWYVLGYGYLIRCESEKQCAVAIDEFKKIHNNLLL
jgi:hypothetical protein